LTINCKRDDKIFPQHVDLGPLGSFYSNLLSKNEVFQYQAPGRESGFPATKESRAIFGYRFIAAGKPLPQG